MAPTPTLATARLAGQPLEAMLPRLHPEHREFLEFFASTVPEPLPEHAYPSWMVVNPASPIMEGPQIVSRSAGYAEVQVGVANPGSHTNRPNLICLRNGERVGCTPDVDVWEVHLPPDSLVLAPVRIPVAPGDQLVFLLMADNDSPRIFTGSMMNWIFVEQEPDPPSAWTDAPVQSPVLGGCDFAVLTKDPSAATSPLNMFRHGDTPRGMVLYLLIQLCNPTGQEYVRLVPVVDRTRVIDLPGPVWHSLVRLVDKLSVIPVDTALLGPAREFQVAVVPYNTATGRALNRQTQTVTLGP